MIMHTHQSTMRLWLCDCVTMCVWCPVLLKCSSHVTLTQKHQRTAGRDTKSLSYSMSSLSSSRPLSILFVTGPSFCWYLPPVPGMPSCFFSSATFEAASAVFRALWSWSLWQGKGTHKSGITFHGNFIRVRTVLNRSWASFQHFLTCATSNEWHVTRSNLRGTNSCSQATPPSPTPALATTGMSCGMPWSVQNFQPKHGCDSVGVSVVVSATWYWNYWTSCMLIFMLHVYVQGNFVAIAIQLLLKLNSFKF